MFTENMIQFFTTGKVGNCPNCKQPLQIIIAETPIRDNYYVNCIKCGKSEYFIGATKLNKQHSAN